MNTAPQPASAATQATTGADAIAAELADYAAALAAVGLAVTPYRPRRTFAQMLAGRIGWAR